MIFLARGEMPRVFFVHCSFSAACGVLPVERGHTMRGQPIRVASEADTVELNCAINAVSAISAAETIVTRYADIVYRLAYAWTHSRTDADDVFQEVFLRYFKQPRHFANEEHRKAWLLRVTINCAKSHLRAVGRALSVADEPVDETASAPDTFRDEALAAALCSLPPNQRAVVHLFYYEDMPVRDIARLLLLQESHVRTLLTRARAKLRELLKGEYDDL